MGIQVPYERGGRTRQKSRTRAALVDAARALMDEGTLPTVEAAADRGGISRTTAYRYFTNRKELVVAVYPEAAQDTLLPADAPADVTARLDLLLDLMAKQLLEREPILRAMLKLSLDLPPDERASMVGRSGRALRWIEHALAPLRKRVSKHEVSRLAIAIRAAFGIEPFVWMTDIAGLSRKAAVDLMRNTAHTLLRAAVDR